jgi:hypothetical protein
VQQGRYRWLQGQPNSAPAALIRLLHVHRHMQRWVASCAAGRVQHSLSLQAAAQPSTCGILLRRFFADAWMLFPTEEEYIQWFTVSSSSSSSSSGGPPYDWHEEKDGEKRRTCLLSAQAVAAVAGNGMHTAGSRQGCRPKQGQCQAAGAGDPLL